jgi:tyrosyl-tRNA synthetase
MSKSDPDSAIFMEDAAEEVERKIRSAYCPTSVNAAIAPHTRGDEGNADSGKESLHLVNDDDSVLNQILDYVRHIVLSPPRSTFACSCCREKGDIVVVYDKYDDVKSDFLAGKISEDQLKDGLVRALNELLQPVRDHFTNDDTACELLEQVREFKRETTTSAVLSGKTPKVFRLDLVRLASLRRHVTLLWHLYPRPIRSLQC